MTAPDNDIDLLKQLQERRPGAFDYMYHKYRHWLFLAAVSFLHSEAEAEEVVQEFLIDFWQKEMYERIIAQQANSLKNFLYVSVRNRCLNRLAKDGTRNKRYRAFLISEDHTVMPNELENKELRVQLRIAISQLPPRQAEVFKQAYISMKTRKEIAREMNISEETVKKQIALALKTLRRLLRKIEHL
ncbi:MAG TPA: sigma-70 family RNA polymerase sigma factor [Anseongella sp.]